MNIKKNLLSQKGFSVLEVILAAAIFMLFSTASVTVILGAYNANRLGMEQTAAAQFASEGIEAVKSIKNQTYSNLTTLNSAPRAVRRNAGNVWEFSPTDGSSSILTHNNSDNYIRQVKIESVNRDAGGNIVSLGGIPDPDTKKITSTVNWNFNSARPESVALSTYLSDWRKPYYFKGGMLAYADLSANDDAIKYKIIDSSGNWGIEQSIPDFNVPNNRNTTRVEIYSSSARNEKIVITKHVETGSGNDQYLYAHVWNGSSWTAAQLTSWSGTASPETRNFDGDYLNNGNFLLVYDNDTVTPRYRIWDGSSWTNETAALNVGGNPEWIVVRNRPNTNEAMVAVYDSNNDTNTLYWDGNSWGGLFEHAVNSTGASFENIGFEWSKNTPTAGALIFNEASDNNPNISIWNGASWNSAENVNIGAATEAMQIITKPNANEFLACFKDTASDINCLESDHTPSWSALTNGEIALNTDSGNQRSFGLSYETISGNKALAVYSNGSNNAARRFPKYRTFDPSSNAWSSESSLTELGASGTSALETVRVIPDPNSNDLMVLMGDSDQDIWSIIWNGSDGSFYAAGGQAQTEHGVNGSNDLDFWYDFAWDKF